MAEYDEILKSYTRDVPEIEIDIPAPFSIFSRDNPVSIVEETLIFKAHDLTIKLFRDVVRSRSFACEMQEWLDKTEWSKKFISILERQITWEEGDGATPAHPSYCYILRARMWVQEEVYAKEFVAEAYKVIERMEQEPGGDFRKCIEIGKLLSHSMLEGGWICKCGYINHYNHRICAECLIPARKTKRKYTLQS